MAEKIPTNEDYISIAQEIKDMYDEDQAMRERALQNDGVIESEDDAALDRKNTLKMKEIVKKIG